MTDVGLYNLDENGVVEFSFSNVDRLVSGPEEALQTAAYALFNEPGSSSFARNEGGGLLAIIGTNIKTKAETNAEAAVAVRRAMETINKTQSSDKASNATITNMRVMDTRINGLEIELDIRIELLDGNSFRATFRI